MKISFLVLLTNLLFATKTMVKGIPGDSPVRNSCLTAEEDARLLKLYEQHKNSSRLWADISKVLERDRKFVRDHYYAVLDPSVKASSTQWTDKEDRIIVEEIKNAKALNRCPKYAEVARQVKRSRSVVYHHFKYIL
jgi:hypothetical protein